MFELTKTKYHSLFIELLTMKKIGLILTLIICSLSHISAQEKLHILKFDPLNLITSSLSFGYETFNEEQTRSWDMHLGFRYNKDLEPNYSYYDSQLPQLDTYDYWKGVQFSVERRMYVPSLKQGKTTKYGVYLAPGVKLDLNSNQFDKSFYNPIYKETSPNNPNYEKVTRTGEYTYFSVMPYMNMGFQFSVFQFGYIDFNLGGGVRILNKKVKSENLPNVNSYGYYSSNNFYENTILKEGVRPTGTITFGIKVK